MNSSTIERYLKRIGVSDAFKGVCPADVWPRTKENDILICNLSSTSEPGTHFVTLHFTGSGNIHYFDSLAMNPSDALKERMDEHLAVTGGRLVAKIKKPIQPMMSYMCGFFALYHVLILDKRDCVKGAGLKSFVAGGRDNSERCVYNIIRMIEICAKT